MALLNVFMGLAIAGRIVLSNFLGLWYPVTELMDDHLMVVHADLLLYIGNPDANSLVKYMGYPLFLNIVHLTGLTYPLFVSLLWILGAILFVRYLRGLCNTRWFLALAFLFLLYTPAAFDLWCGTRLYRNAVIAPLALITFSLALLLFERLREKGKFGRKLLLSIGLGVFLTATYYQKEDGIWILACILAVAVIAGIRELVAFFRKRGRRTPAAAEASNKRPQKPKEKKVPNGGVEGSKAEFEGRIRAMLVHIVLLVFPFLLFAGVTLAYKAFNLRYFGVFETNTRTSGEIGKFTSKLYEIESPDRDATIWVPFDAIKQAFAASETLSKYPELLEGLVNDDPKKAGPNVTEKGIAGDFITWRLRTELSRHEIWTNDAEMQALFANVNRELDAAFADGRLKKDGRIRVSKSGGGRTLGEIFELLPEMVEAARTIVSLSSYELGGSPGLYAVGDPSAEIATTLTGVNLVDHDESTLNLREATWMNHFVEVIFIVYRVVNIAMIFVAVLGAVLTCVLLILTRKKKNMSEADKKTPAPVWNRQTNARFAGMMLLLAGFFAAYLLAISWFCEFIWTTNEYDNKFLKFYSIGGVPLFAMMVLIGAGLLWNGIRKLLLRSR